MSDVVVDFNYLKNQLFHFAELFSIEKQKDPLDWNELIYLNRSIKNHMEMMIVKLNEENPKEDGKTRGDIFTPDEMDLVAKLMTINPEIIDAIENEFGPVWD